MTDKVLATYQGQQEIAEAILGINLEALTQKAVWVDSVADMRELDAPQGITVATRGYYEPNDGGNGFYYIRAKEVGSVDDGGSVIFLDNDNEAKLITDGTVNVKQFGAKGDGVTADDVAIANAIGFCDANKRLYFPPCDGFLVNNPVVVTNPNQNAEPQKCPSSIVMDAPIIYEGDGIALTIGTAGQRTRNRQFLLRTISKTKSSVTSTGIEVLCCSSCDIHLIDINGFYNAFVLFGDTVGASDNRIFTNTIQNCAIGLTVTNDNGGWAMDNSFFEGSIFYRNGSTTKTGILITRGANGTNPNNQNIFYGIDVQTSKIGVQIDYGNYNKFFGMRFEAVDLPSKCSNASCWNYIGSSANYSTYTYETDGFNFYSDYIAEITSQHNNVVMDTGFLPIQCVQSGNYMSGSGILSTNANTGYKVEKYNTHLLLPSTRFLGYAIDTTVAKSFVVNVHSTSNTDQYVVRLNIYDKDGVEITDGVVSPPNHTIYYGSGRWNYPPISVTEPAYFIVPDNCVKMIFYIVGSGDNGLHLTRLVLLSDRVGNCTEGIMRNPLLTSAPTCEGKPGDICYKSNYAGSGVKYWIYLNSTWEAIS